MELQHTKCCVAKCNSTLNLALASLQLGLLKLELEKVDPTRLPT